MSILSNRAKGLKPSPTLAINAKAKAMQAQGMRVVSFGAGEPDFDTPENIKRAAIKSIEEGFTKYTAVGGIDELKDAVIHKFQRDNQLTYKRSQILVSCGGKHSFYNLAQALFDRGDEVIIPDPFFVMYEYQVLLMGGVPVFVDTYPDFRLREEEFVKKLSDKTKFIIINSPNNPTGTVYPQEDLLMEARIARERELLILSDDIYDNFVFDAPACPCMGQLYENTLTFGGFSKGWGMTGWRLGYVAGAREILQQMITLQQYTFSSVNSFAQKAAIKALDFNVDDYIEQYRKKRDLIYEGLKEKYHVQKPLGAFYIFPEVPGGNGEAFVERAIRQNLFIIPGSVFSKRNTHVRISFAASEEVLSKGIEVLNRIG